MSGRSKKPVGGASDAGAAVETVAPAAPAAGETGVAEAAPVEAVAEAAPVEPVTEPAPVPDVSHATAPAIADTLAGTSGDLIIDGAAFDKRAVRVTATQDERRRAGLKFTREPMILTPEMVDVDKLEQLVADPFLKVEVTIDGESWRPAADLIAETIS